jgi:hypothetical protein
MLQRPIANRVMPYAPTFFTSMSVPLNGIMGPNGNS